MGNEQMCFKIQLNLIKNGTLHVQDCEQDI